MCWSWPTFWPIAHINATTASFQHKFVNLSGLFFFFFSICFTFGFFFIFCFAFVSMPASRRIYGNLSQPKYNFKQITYICKYIKKRMYAFHKLLWLLRVARWDKTDAGIAVKTFEALCCKHAAHIFTRSSCLTVSDRQQAYSDCLSQASLARFFSW